MQSLTLSPACPRIAVAIGACLAGTVTAAGGSAGSRWLSAVKGSAWVAQVGEDGEGAPVGAGVGAEAELEEDLLDVGFDGALGDEQAGGDGLVGQPFGDQSEHLTFPFGELVERAGRRWRAKSRATIVGSTTFLRRRGGGVRRSGSRRRRRVL